MWHRQGWAGGIIRLAGLAAIAVSIGAAGLLCTHHSAQLGAADPIDFVLALLAFLPASCGIAMLFLGAHLFDEVEISARWRSLRLSGHAQGQDQRPHSRCQQAKPNLNGVVQGVDGADR